MGAFKIEIVGVGGHGCDRKAKAGEKLYGRCGRFGCPDCMAHDFVQQLRQKGLVRDGDQATGGEVVHSSACSPNSDDGCTCHAIPEGAETYWVRTQDGLVVSGSMPAGCKQFWKKPHRALFTHWPDSKDQVVDDMLKNERKAGQF